ncbi:MAG: phosphoribosylformylglycinamidine synthase I [Phycisphaerae bacterium]|nr:phosphoribosylformylglycinamidine synthase I [Phycisphaerae bacterium]
MATPRVLILRAAGINCDEETEHAWRLAGAEPERIHINRILERPRRLLDYQVVTLPGGFSYGDDIASGKILATQLRLHLMTVLEEFVGRDGLLIGICNGFQVLVKAGLLPGAGLPRATVTYNDSGHFEARWVTMRAESSSCVMVEAGEVLSMPVAHGEGKVIVERRADGDALAILKTAGCVALRYINPSGGPAGYPFNPNGSEGDIAGLCDRSGRVFGLMPHPERFHDRLQRAGADRDLNADNDGLRIFRRAVRYFA